MEMIFTCHTLPVYWRVFSLLTSCHDLCCISSSVRSRIKALDGLLSVGDLSMVAPVPDSSPTDLPDSHLAKFSCASNFIDEDDDDDEKRLMADCIQDGDFSMLLLFCCFVTLHCLCIWLPLDNEVLDWIIRQRLEIWLPLI